jgi:Tfp pilus assembly protein PilN
MAEFELNLSTRPFPAYRLVNLALSFVLIALILLSVWQVYGFLQYSSMARAFRPEEQALRVESETLGQQLNVLRGRLDRPESAAKLKEIEFLNSIIARKELSWTELFANLEDLVPNAVLLTGWTPEILPDGTASLALAARGRSINDIKDFIAALEQSPLFDDVKVFREEVQGTELAIELTARYYPTREAMAR